MSAGAALAPADARLLRDLAPEVLAALMRRYRDFSAAEDAVQEALVAAATQWPASGVPESPRAWLIHVASRRIVDHVRAEAARRRREDYVVSLAPADEQVAAAPDEPAADDALTLLFMCCHPSLTRASAIALTLRAVGGLTTAEIARAFLVPEATMAQRISRAKQTIQESGIPFALPSPDEASARLAAALHTLYLSFSEGYAATSGDAVHRTDLSNEAIRLTRLLRAALPDDAEVAGLLALMLLTDARRDARTGPAGELVPLDEQDRTRWDRAAIAEGVALVTEALARGAVGAYQLQAAIAAVHDEAPSTRETDWEDILGLYGVLARVAPNPVVELNRAIAIGEVHGPVAGLERLDAIAGDPRLASGHRLDAVRAHMLERAGRVAEAVALYLRAADRTTNTAERNHLLTRAAGLRDRR